MVAPGCKDGIALTRMLVFVSGYSLSYLATAGLLRYSHGATWAALTATLVTPAGALFWTLFNESPFKFEPHTTLTTWTALAGLCIMLPAVYFFHTFATEEEEDESPEIASQELPSSHSRDKGAGSTVMGDVEGLTAAVAVQRTAVKS